MLIAIKKATKHRNTFLFWIEIDAIKCTSWEAEVL